MAVATPYTTESKIVTLAGQLGVDLRLDDSVDAADDLQDAIDVGTTDADFYLQRYSQTALAASEWVQWTSTYFAVRFLCQRRLNEVPKSLKDECERREKLLQLILDRKANVPRVAASRRPVAVNNYHVDTRQYNNQIRVDKSRTTGVAEDYRRPIDETAPDER